MDKKDLDRKVDNLDRSMSEKVEDYGGNKPHLHPTDEGPTPSIKQDDKSLELNRNEDNYGNDIGRNLNHVTQEDANLVTGRGGVKNKDEMGK